MRGDTSAVRALLAQKADVNVTQADGATALHWAVYREDFATTDLLIQAGANVKVASREGATPLSLAVPERQRRDRREPAQGRRGSEREAAARRDALMMASRTGQRGDDEGAARPRRGRECERNDFAVRRR